MEKKRKRIALVDVVYDGGTHAMEVYADGVYVVTTPPLSSGEAKEIRKAYEAGEDLFAWIDDMYEARRRGRRRK